MNTLALLNPLTSTDPAIVKLTVEKQQTDKTFTFGGVSDLNGIYKLRVANDAGRVKVLLKNGHKDIRLIQLPDAFTKTQAVNFLKEHEDFQDIMAQGAFADFESVKVPVNNEKRVTTVDTNEDIRSLTTAILNEAKLKTELAVI
jgi:hypothetical protein